ncbi:hypothetical protein F4813DRAFT_354962 [Daldinia decipiens]|uniref:uncharacterized protein n=1 Tax=Daldinia decipiens TaxID=326647 RepID=UPI0020C5A553|nr:uncharacterized protein F4813DRAFT_354962 [Daldinia decipiens]KAI1658864.1 hypothetical protein F4813DRAFT_354962 [Daldinia decipiens]
MSSKAPSEGTKVTAGRNAPVSNEAPGVVSQGSLAAESQAFRQANQAAPQQVGREDLTSASKPHEGGIHKASSTNKSGPGRSSNVDTAPSYVQSQFLKGKGGPHGKNLTEDDSIGTEDKNKNASFSEFGTKNDPGLAAEKKFISGSANTGSNAGREKRIDDQQPYAALGGDTQA